MIAAWPKVTFDEAPLQIIDGDRGSNYPKQDEFHEAGHCLFLNTGNVTKSGFKFGNCQFITEKKDDLLRKGKLAREDIIMTTRGTIGNVAYFNRHVPFENIRINSGMVIFRTYTEKLLPSFLYQYLRSDQFNKQVNSLRSGAAQPQLPIRDIKVIELPLPPIPQQEAISELISKYDDLIGNNKRQIELLEESAQQLYKEWFVRFRFPGHEHVKIIDGVPEGWAKKRIEDVCTVSGGGTPSREVSEFWDNGDVTWFSPTDLSKAGSLCLLDSSQKITDLGLKKSSAKLMGPETFMMTSRATIGLFGLIGKSYSTNQGFINVSPEAPAHKYFLLFNFKLRVPEFYNYASGATFPEISKSKFKRLKISWPSDSLIQNFYEFSEPIIFEMMNITKQNKLLREARDLLLPKLMSGEVAV